MITLLLAAAAAAPLTWEARAELDNVAIAENRQTLAGGTSLTSLGLAGGVDLGKYVGVDLGWHYGRRESFVGVAMPEVPGAGFETRFGAQRIELGARAQVPVLDLFIPYVGARGALALVRHTIDQDLDQIGNTIEEHRSAVAPGLELVAGFGVGTPVRDKDDPYGSEPRVGLMLRFELGWSTYARFDLAGLGDARLGGATGTVAIGARYR